MCPSGAVLTIPLGPTNPWLIYIAKETLIFRRADISSALRLLVPTFLLRNAPPWLAPLASLQMRILSYHLKASLRIPALLDLGLRFNLFPDSRLNLGVE